MGDSTDPKQKCSVRWLNYIFAFFCRGASATYNLEKSRIFMYWLPLDFLVQQKNSSDCFLKVLLEYRYNIMFFYHNQIIIFSSPKAPLQLTNSRHFSPPCTRASQFNQNSGYRNHIHFFIFKICSEIFLICLSLGKRSLPSQDPTILVR